MSLHIYNILVTLETESFQTNINYIIEFIRLLQYLEQQAYP